MLYFILYPLFLFYTIQQNSLKLQLPEVFHVYIFYTLIPKYVVIQSIEKFMRNTSERFLYMMILFNQLK